MNYREHIASISALGFFGALGVFADEDTTGTEPPKFAEMGDAEVVQLFWNAVESGDVALAEACREEANRREMVL